jgi:hypothetical protein
MMSLAVVSLFFLCGYNMLTRRLANLLLVMDFGSASTVIALSGAGARC